MQVQSLTPCPTSGSTIGNTGSIGLRGIGSTGMTGYTGSTGYYIGLPGSTGMTGHTGSTGWIEIDDEKIKERVIKQFIWKPTKIKKRWRWLIYTYVKQQLSFWNLKWINVEFLLYSEYLEWRIVNE